MALYGILLALPMTGWLLSSAASHAISVFGFISVPSLGRVEPESFAPLKRLHWLLGLALGTIVLLHVAAALRHHFWLKDGVLTRMLPRRLGRRLP
jgi:cytochrome b561